MLTRKIKTGIVFSLALAFIVIVAIAFYADFPHMVTALVDFRWEFFPLQLLLALSQMAILSQSSRNPYSPDKKSIDLPIGPFYGHYSWQSW